MDRKITVVLICILLASLYKNYKQYIDGTQAKARVELIAKTGLNAISGRIKTDSSERVVYTDMLASSNSEKVLATGKFIDTLSRFINIPVKRIEEVTRVHVIKYDTVKVIVTQDSLQNPIYRYANKWLSVQLNTKDSTLQYNYKVELADYQYSKGILFWKKTYREVALADPAAKVVGVQRFSMPVTSPSRLGLGVIGGVDIQGHLLLGVGLSWQFIRF